MFRLLLPAFLGLAIASPSPDASGVASVIGRIPSQIGDSANAIVGSLGGEIGSGLGTVGEGAIGRGVGNIGNLGIGEAKKVAEAVGDTVHGVSGVASGIVGGLLRGSGKTKRQTSPLDGLSLLQHANLLKLSASQASNNAFREVCKLIAVLESAAANSELASIAPGFVPKIQEFLALIKNSVCVAVNVSGDVENLVNGVFGKQ